MDLSGQTIEISGQNVKISSKSMEKSGQEYGYIHPYNYMGIYGRTMNIYCQKCAVSY